MNRIQTQAQKLWQMLSAPETGKTYQQAWTATVQILKETGLLLWLVVCLFLVFFDWFWKFSIKSGSDLREWFNTLERPSPERIVSESGRTLLTVGQDSLNKVLTQARAQLGLPQPAIAPAASARPAAPPPEVPPAAPTPAAPPAVPPAVAAKKPAEAPSAVAPTEEKASDS